MEMTFVFWRGRKANRETGELFFFCYNFLCLFVLFPPFFFFPPTNQWISHSSKFQKKNVLDISLIAFFFFLCFADQAAMISLVYCFVVVAVGTSTAAT